MSGGAPGRDTTPVGVVLCGGSSSRMGTDKALIGSPPWALRVARALLGAGCEPVVFLGGDPRLESLGHALVEDDRPGSGPLAALTAVTRRWHGRHIVAAACDLPDLTPKEVDGLIGALDEGAGPRVTAYRLDGELQWSLLAIDPDAAAGIAALVARGRRALRSLEPWCVAVDGRDGDPLRDVDDPDSARDRGLEGPWDRRGP